MIKDSVVKDTAIAGLSSTASQVTHDPSIGSWPGPSRGTLLAFSRSTN
jgi:hypothetical protein